MASEALASHRVSLRNDWSSERAKYLDPDAGGRPRGFSNPMEIKTVMSLSPKPRNKRLRKCLGERVERQRQKVFFFLFHFRRAPFAVLCEGGMGSSIETIGKLLKEFVRTKITNFHRLIYRQPSMQSGCHILSRSGSGETTAIRARPVFKQLLTRSTSSPIVTATDTPFLLRLKYVLASASKEKAELLSSFRIRSSIPASDLWLHLSQCFPSRLVYRRFRLISVLCRQKLRAVRKRHGVRNLRICWPTCGIATGFGAWREQSHMLSPVQKNLRPIAGREVAGRVASQNDHPWRCLCRRWWRC